MIHIHNLNIIPGEKVSENHLVFLFLRNIHDTKYESAATYLRNSRVF